MFCVLALQVVAGTYAYLKQNQVEKNLTTQLTKGVNVIYGKEDAASKGLTKAIDWFQVPYYIFLSLILELAY